MKFGAGLYYAKRHPMREDLLLHHQHEAVVDVLGKELLEVVFVGVGGGEVQEVEAKVEGGVEGRRLQREGVVVAVEEVRLVQGEEF